MQTSFQTATTDERRMAALAHGSILLTFVVSVTTGGLATLAAVLVPLFIWFLYRERSAYVAFHALQATVFQLALLALSLAATVAVGAVLVVVWVVTGLLSLLLVGVLLVPVAIVLSVVGGLAVALIPLAGLGYGLFGAWEVYNGADFRYRWVADWLENRV